MEIRMKGKRRLKLLIVSVLAILGNFICGWFYCELFNRYFIFFLLIYVAFFVLLLACVIKSLMFLKKYHESPKDFLVISIIVLYLGFCTWGGVEKLNFTVYKNKRYEIVKMVQENQIKVNSETGEIALSDRYKRVSDGSAVVLYDKRKEIAVGFWIDRGFLDSGFSMYVYESNDEDDYIETAVLEMWPFYEEYEVNIERLEKKWFRVVVAEKR